MKKRKLLLKTLLACAFAVSAANAQGTPAPEEAAADTIIDMSRLPPDSLVIDPEESDFRQLKACWRSFVNLRLGADPDEWPLVQAYKTGPRTKVTEGAKTYDADPLGLVVLNQEKFLYFPEAFGILTKNASYPTLRYTTIAFFKAFTAPEITDFKPKPKKSELQFAALKEAIEKGPPPMKKADLPKSKWNGPKIEPQLKKLMQQSYDKIEKVIIRNDTWGYERNTFGVVLSRWVQFDVIYEGKKEGKKAYFYKPGYVAKQMHNGKDFDKTFVRTGVPVTDSQEVEDWK